MRGPCFSLGFWLAGRHIAARRTLQRRYPFSDQRDAFGVNDVPADLRHHHFRHRGLQSIDQNRIVGISRYQIVTAFAHIAGGDR